MFYLPSCHSSFTSFKHGSLLSLYIVVSSLVNVVAAGIWCNGAQLNSRRTPVTPVTLPLVMAQRTATGEEVQVPAVNLKTMLSKRRGLLGRFTVIANEIESLLDDFDDYDRASISDCLSDLETAFHRYSSMHENVLHNLTDLSHVSRLNAKHHTVVSQFQSLCARTNIIIRSNTSENRYASQQDAPDRSDHSAMLSLDRTGVFDRDDVDNDRSSSFSSAFSKLSSSIHQAKTALAKAKAKAEFEVRMAQIDLEDAMGVEEELASISGDGFRSSKPVSLEKKTHQSQFLQEDPSDPQLKTNPTIPPKREDVLPNTDDVTKPKDIDDTPKQQLRPAAPEWIPQHFTPSCMQSPLALAPMLPRPELLSFNGNSTEFITFRQSFLNYIDTQPISPAYKLGYLLQYCTGEAKEAIKDCIVLPVEDGYQEAWSILCDQFGRPHVIAKAHLNTLLHGPAIQMSDPKSLITLARKMRSCEMALSDGSFSADLNSENTLNEIAKRLPKPLRVKWVDRATKIQKYRGFAPRFHDLLEFIKEQADVCNSSFADTLLARDTSSQQSMGKTSKPKNTLATTAEVTKMQQSVQPSKVQADSKRPKCVVCCEDHYLPFCDRFIRMPLNDRLKIAKDENLCFNCLRKGHGHSDCPKESFCKQDGCHVKHSKFLHRDTVKKTTTESSQAMSCSYSQSKNGICLQVVPCLVKGKGSHPCQVYALLDQCSNVSLCTDALILKLGIQGKPSAIDVSTVSGFLHSETKEVVLTARDMDCNVNLNLNKVYSVAKLPFTPESIPLENDLKRWPHLKDLRFPSVPVEEISLLIGADNPAAFKVLDTREGSDGEPYAVRYPLGWTVIGPLSANDQHHKGFTAHFIQAATVEEDMSKLWNPDFGDLPTVKRAMSLEDEKALKLMQNTAYLDEDNHWNIRLPWRNDPPDLPNNRTQAESRFKHLQKKFDSDVAFRDQYTEKMNTYLSSGFAVKASDDPKTHVPKWYLPHHAVHHPRKRKIRVVFDCSAKYNQSSLNQELLQGPDLMNNLVGVILRFRQERVAIAADIEGMFHQVRVHECDRNALRFLWFEDGKTSKDVIEYQMAVHLFGATSSPSVCCFALKETANIQKTNSSSSAVNTIHNNFYMDDLLKSTATIDQASALASELTDVLKKGGFRLTKWISNDPTVLATISPDDRSDKLKEFDGKQLPVESALGISWDIHSDSFKFRIHVEAKSLTRRGILSELSSLYDPCGFTAPVLLKAKALLQTLSARQCNWDDPLPQDIEDQWRLWKSALTCLEEESVPRCFIPKSSQTDHEYQLHLFSDASETGYAAVAYLRINDSTGDIQTAFVLGKSRVAPTKTVSIPRLELTAATLAAKMATFIKEELELQLQQVVFWTDSMTVLQYLSNTKRRFKVFVANRLSIIRDHSSISQWRHVPSKVNPADIGSRGIMPSNRESLKFWLSGPDFLRSELWPINPSIPDISSNDKEVKSESTPSYLTVAGEESLLDDIISKQSSWNRLIRITAWIQRFILRCQRKSNDKGCLTVNELKDAHNRLIQHVQKKTFQSEYNQLISGKNIKKSSRLQPLHPVMIDGILCVGGRLSRAQTPLNPAILPPDSHLSTLLVRHYHRISAHSGVDYILSQLRSKYWILKGRPLIKKVISCPKNGCALCKRYSSKLQHQLMADLPTSRVTPAQHPFTDVGIDYFGPILVQFKRGTAKRYGCLFTCMASRAVHIEIAHSLDTDSFLAAFQRFMARRGKPSRVYSDNGTNFVAGSKELKERIREFNSSKIQDNLSQKEIQWSFNPPAASHMGGVWERLIRSVRSILQRILKEQVVKDEALLTIMAEVEKILNDRPLWPPSSDSKDERPLTPNHLLLHDENPCLPVGIFTQSDNYARRWWKQANYLTNIFWKRWLQEYLPSLQKRTKWQRPAMNFKEGDVVLVSSENVSRGQWPLGLVTTTYPDEKGRVRVVELRTKKGIVKRPIHKLCLLEQA